MAADKYSRPCNKQAMFSPCENGLPGYPDRYTSLCSAYQYIEILYPGIIYR
jgi:hypothetical protein